MGELDGVTTFCELAVPLAVRIAEKLGLPHNTPDAIDYARNKASVCACVYFLTRLTMHATRQVYVHNTPDAIASARDKASVCVCVYFLTRLTIHATRQVSVRAFIS